MPKLWHVYYVSNYRQMTPPKSKFVVIVCYDSKWLGFIINTDIHPFIKKRPHLLAGQASIKKEHDGFLFHDSWVNCTELHNFVSDELDNGRGLLSDETKAAIQKAVENTKTIEPRYQKMILSG